MRLCIIKGDSGYKPSHVLAQYRVFFNGVERKDCEVADEERGYIRTVRVVINSITRQRQVFRSHLFGIVKIEGPGK